MSENPGGAWPDWLNGALALTVIGFLVEKFITWFKSRQDKNEDALGERVTKAALQHEVDMIKERIDDKLSVLADRISELTRIEREHATLDKEFRHQKFDAFQQTQANRFGMVERRLDKLDHAVERVKEDGDRRTEQIDKVCEKVDKLDRRIFKLDGRENGHS